MGRVALLLIASLFFSRSYSFAQNHRVRITSWNLLNWPNASNVNDTTQRCPHFRNVINHIRPDVLVTVENNTATGTDWFLNQVMNSTPLHYSKGTFINGFDSDNAIYYRDSVFRFISNTPWNTSLRDISQFTLEFIPTGDTLHIFVVHLKAGQGYEVERYDEIEVLRSVTNQLPVNTNFLVAGDFNFYGSFEPAYQKLLEQQPGNFGHFHDPLQMTGIWSDPAYSTFHTQSTRVTSFGGGANGGLDDRFDMILYSEAVSLPTGAYFLQNEYVSHGNDGQHFNQAINAGLNTAVPPDVATSLHNTSDHLPVSMMLEIGPTAGIPDRELLVSGLSVYPNPAGETAVLSMTLSEKAALGFSVMDLTGKELVSVPFSTYYAGYQQVRLDFIKSLTPGSYLLSVLSHNGLYTTRLLLFR